MNENRRMQADDFKVHPITLLAFFGVILLLAGQSLITAASSINVSQTNSSVVSITDQGFDPPVLTIPSGTNVTWTNHTAQFVEIIGTPLHKVYLPIILRENSLVHQQVNSNGGSSVVSTLRQSLNNEWQSGLLEPGDSYTHLFAEPGEYTYFLAGNSSINGQIIVSETVLPTETATPSPTTIPTETDTPVATSTPTTEPPTTTYTPMATVTNTYTPTNTPSSTPDPTDTPTATATTMPTETPTQTPEPKPTQEFCGIIEEDTIWQDDFIYIVTCNSVVAPSATLAVQPGAVIKFSDASSGFVIDGTLSAQGLLNEPVVFTSIHDDSYGNDTANNGTTTLPNAGDWRQLYVGSTGTATLSYAVVKYAGSVQGGIRSQGGILTVSNTIVAHNGTTGIYYHQSTPNVTQSHIVDHSSHGIYVVHSQGGTLTPHIHDNMFVASGQAVELEITSPSYLTGNNPFAGNNGTDNNLNGIRLRAVITGTTTLTPNEDFPYVVPYLFVPREQALLLEPGTIFKMEGGMDVSGHLTATGMVEQPIVFTSLTDDSHGGDTNGDGDATVPSSGQWDQITLHGGSLQLDHAIVMYGGGCSPAPAVINDQYTNCTFPEEFDQPSSIHINNSTIAYNSVGGISGTGNPLTVTNSTIANNNGSGIRFAGEDSGAVIIGNGIDDNSGIGVHVTQANNIQLVGNTFTSNDSYAALLIFVNGTFLSMFDNYGTDNGGNGIAITGYLDQDTILPQHPAHFPYIIPANLTVNSDTILTILPGSVLKMANSILSIEGTLIAEGTHTESIVITSLYDDSVAGGTNGKGDTTQPTPGDWHSIRVEAHGSLIIDMVDMRFGGPVHASPLQGMVTAIGPCGELTINNSHLTSSQTFAIFLSDACATTIHNSTFTHNTAGIYGRGQALVIEEITNNQFIDNNGLAMDFYGTTPLGIGNHFDIGNIANNTSSGFLGDQILFHAFVGTINPQPIHINNSATFGSNPGMPYVPRVRLIVEETLYLEAGAIFKMIGQTNNRSGIAANRIEASGTEQSPIIFTSLLDDSVEGDTNGDGDATSPGPGDWTRVSANDCELEYVEFYYGGGGIWAGSKGSLNLGSGICVIKDSRFQYSDTNGLLSNSDSLLIHDSHFEDNYQAAWFHTGEPATIRYSHISGNDAGVVYNQPERTIDARYNWWGDNSGPYPYGLGDAVYGNVLVNPWTGSQGQVIHNASPSTPWASWVSDPVNTVFGNFIYQYTDLAFSARGLDFVFRRTYNSSLDYDGPLGHGWTHSYNITATYPATETVILVRREDGRLDTYLRQENGSYLPPPGIHDQLISNGVTLTLTLKNQAVYTFDTNGRLATMRDPNGNAITLDYTGDNLTSINMADGREVTFTYTGGWLTSLTDPAGRTVFFEVNNALLTHITDVTGQVTAHTYDDQNRLTAITDANGHTFVDNVYDNHGRVVEQLDAQLNLTTFSYYTETRQTVVVDPHGVSKTYTYDSAFRATGEIDAFGNQTVYQYDIDNNRIAATDKLGGTTFYTYDARGNLLSITDPLEFTRSFTYDQYNNLLSDRDPLDNVTSYQYDANHNVIHRTDSLDNINSWSYDSSGLVLTTTDPRSHSTAFGYDNYGHRTVITDALGNTSTTVFDIVGRLLNETDALGRTTTYTYDNANRLLSVTDAHGEIASYAYDAVGNRISLVDPRGGITTFSYNAKDQLVGVTDSLGNATTFSYDAVSNRISVTDPVSNTTNYIYDNLNRRIAVTDPLGHTTTYTYDGNGNRTSMTDANGNSTFYTYDARNQLNHVIDAQGGVVSYTYDGNGNRTSLTDANGNTILYNHDSLNRLLTTMVPLGYITAYTYDAVGNRTTTTKADNIVISYTYDPLGRLSEIVYPDGNINYAYDAVGNRLAMTDTIGITIYSYDDLNRLTTVVMPTGTLEYNYDANGNRTNLTYPGGQVVTYTYNSTNRLTSIIDWDKRETTYTYDAAGRQDGMSYPNGVQVTSAYDAAGRLLSLGHIHPGYGTIVSFTYTLDPVGNRLTMVDLDGTTSYIYDNLYRLVQVTYPEGEIVSYSYDPAGNRTAMNSTVNGPVTYNYDAGDRLLSLTNVDGLIGFTWDANGNMLSKDNTNYSFDALNRLVQVVDENTTVQFDYNGDGVRLRKTVDNSEVTAYLQDVAAPLSLVLSESTGPQSNRYVYGNELLMVEEPFGELSFYHADGLGSIRALSDLVGQTTDNYGYDIFGTLRSHIGNTTQPFGFTGEQVDDELEFVFLRARYYDPEVGRFISSDSFPRNLVSTQSLHRFAYALNNPVRFVDPSGYFSVSGIWEDHISPYATILVDFGTDAANLVRSYTTATTGYFSNLSSGLRFGSGVADAGTDLVNLYDFAERATGDEDLYWQYRTARHLNSGAFPTRSEIEDVQRYGFDVAGQRTRALQELGRGTHQVFGHYLVNAFFPLDWKGPDNDTDYQRWLQEVWYADSNSRTPARSLRNYSNYRTHTNWGIPPSQAK